MVCPLSGGGVKFFRVPVTRTTTLPRSAPEEVEEVDLMNTIVTTAALQPCTRALTPVHAFPTTWHSAPAPQGVVRLRDERAAHVARAAVNAAAATAAACANPTGPLVWSPPPC